MEISANHLRSVAIVFRSESGHLREDCAEVLRELEGIGNFWGTGKEGAVFLRGEGGTPGYQGASEQIRKGVGALSQAHGDIALGLSAMAGHVEEVDFASVLTMLATIPKILDDKARLTED